MLFNVILCVRLQPEYTLEVPSTKFCYSEEVPYNTPVISWDQEFTFDELFTGSVEVTTINLFITYFLTSKLVSKLLFKVQY